MRIYIRTSLLTKRSPPRPNLPRREHRPIRNQSSKNSEPPSPDAIDSPISPPSDTPGFVPPAGSAVAPTPTTVSTSGLGFGSFLQMVERSVLGEIGRAYMRMQDRRPYVTQVASAMVVYLCGDLSAQLLFSSDNNGTSGAAKESTSQEASLDVDESQSRGSSYDPWRTLRHLAVGAGASLPAYHWFMFLHRNFNFTSKPLSILTKVIVQQIVFTPVFNTYFFSMQSLLAGGSLSETLERLQMALPVSIKNSVKLWPAVTAFSFLYVPAQLRNVFAGVVAVGWQTYLSWLNQKAAKEVHISNHESLPSTGEVARSASSSSAAASRVAASLTG